MPLFNQMYLVIEREASGDSKDLKGRYLVNEVRLCPAEILCNMYRMLSNKS